MKKQLNLPHFNNEDEERDFWAQINLADYYEPSDAEPVSFPNLKPTTRPLSLHLPIYMIDRIKERANALGMPYQALIKSKLGELL
ncbi:MAG: BrnA antitoxin family protein [Anaerolineae bacterium]|nr:BrnA antitoxin family protein [Anaerolineae bacterium]